MWPTRRSRPVPDPSPPRFSRAGDHLGTDHLRDHVVARSVRGGIVTLGAQGAKVAVQVVAVVLLARLLAPADFGVFAMVAAFLGVLEMLKDLGLSTATVQRAEISSPQVSALFWLNAGLGMTVTLGLAGLAPALAWLFDEPVLLHIVPVVALAFLINGFGTQHLALLRRQMRFSVIAVVQVGGEIAALTAAVAAALAGLGIWALVVQRLVWAGATTLGAWIACDWRPVRPARFAEIRGMVAFGGNATGSMIISYMASNLDKVLIGWWWGAAPLGLFERAQKLLLLPVQNLNTPLATVALPALSRLIGQPARYRAVYLAAAERLAMLIAPLGGLFIVAGDLIVALVLGPQWSQAAPILTWMGLSVIYMPVTYTLSWLYMSQDRTPEMLRAGLVNAGISVAVLIASLPFGPVAVAATYAISGIVLRVPLLFWLVGRHGPVRMPDLVRVLKLPVCAVAAVAAMGAGVRAWIVPAAAPAPMVMLLVLTAAGSAILCVYGAFPHGRQVFRDTARQMRTFFTKEAKA